MGEIARQWRHEIDHLEACRRPLRLRFLPAPGRTVPAGGVAPESYEIGRHCHLTARQHQVEAVVNRMIRMCCQGESFRLQGATDLLCNTPSAGSALKGEFEALRMAAQRPGDPGCAH
jgi:hypothetical protein